MQAPTHPLLALFPWRALTNTWLWGHILLLLPAATQLSPWHPRWSLSWRVLACCPSPQRAFSWSRKQGVQRSWKARPRLRITPKRPKAPREGSLGGVLTARAALLLKVDGEIATGAKGCGKPPKEFPPGPPSLKPALGQKDPRA